MKTVKRFRITERKCSLYSTNERVYTQEGTLEELIKAYSYTLEVGRSYQHERGNKKINCCPKNIQSLCTNLYNAKNNAAANGYSGSDFSYEQIQ